jgi:hypothetical protein
MSTTQRTQIKILLSVSIFLLFFPQTHTEVEGRDTWPVPRMKHWKGKPRFHHSCCWKENCKRKDVWNEKLNGLGHRRVKTAVVGLHKITFSEMLLHVQICIWFRSIAAYRLRNITYSRKQTARGKRTGEWGRREKHAGKFQPSRVSTRVPRYMNVIRSI